MLNRAAPCQRDISNASIYQSVSSAPKSMSVADHVFWAPSGNCKIGVVVPKHWMKIVMKENGASKAEF